MSMPLRMTTTHVVKVLVGSAWMALPSQLEGQSKSEARLIYRASPLSPEKKKMVKVTNIEENVNPDTE